jgi:cytochrome c-type biogenesis protein CcsB
MNHALLGFATLAYCVAGVGYLWVLFRADPVAARVGSGALVLGLLLHGGALGLKLWHYGFTPATNAREGLSLLAWLLGICFLVLNRRYRLPILGAFVAPLVLVVTLPVLLWPTASDRPLPPGLQNGLLFLHIVAAFLGYALFALAFGVGVCYLVQEGQLKGPSGPSRLWSRLPSLDVLDRINRILVSAGFVMLTFTLASGAFFARGAWGGAWTWEPKEIITLVAWLLYAGLIQARALAGWQGRRAAILSFIGFGILMGSLVGLSLCPVDRHGGTFQ